MANCLSRACDNDVKGRRYCCGDCKVAERIAREAKPRLEDVIGRYKEVEPDVSILMENAWLLFPVAQSDDNCIGDFMRVFERAPDHVIFDPKTPLWKFAGPVWPNEELTYRWRP